MRPLRTRWVLLVAALAATAAGCSDEGDPPADEPLLLPEGCNPLAANVDCLLPYPSDVFLVPDDDLPSGQRLHLPEAALVRNIHDQAVDLTAAHQADGFSVGQQILALFPGGIDDGTLATAHGDPGASLAPDSPTVLLDTVTGERIVHLAELDAHAAEDEEDEEDRRGLLIRPLVRLEHERRYVVAIRSLHHRDGTPAATPAGFGRIRDGLAPAETVLAPLAERYEQEIFPALEQAGVARGALQLAWDFTTRSEQNATADLLAIRQDVIAQLTGSPPVVTVDSVEDDVSDSIYRRIDATVTVPLYLESNETLARLHRDDNGTVAPNGTVEVPVLICIPRSVAEATPGSPRARLVLFGHGFFGSREELTAVAGYFGDQVGAVLVATDWQGMSEDDRIALSNTIIDAPNDTMAFTDAVQQAMANTIAVELAARGPLALLPEMQLGGQSVYDTDETYFYGISNGGILGGTFMALTPTIERGALSVGGANYSLMAFRAGPFAAFLLIIQNQFPDPLDQQKVVLHLQSSFDRIDPLSYAPHVLGEPYPDGIAERRLLMQVGIGDIAVPNLSSHLQARALGLRNLEPAPRAVYGLEGAASPHAGSALVEFDFGIDPLPGLDPVVGTLNDVHDDVRRLDAANEQLDRFFRPDGRIEQICDGVCDPE